MSNEPRQPRFDNQSSTSKPGSKEERGGERPVVVLFVDDFEVAARGIKRLLERHAGFVVHTAPSIEEGLKLLNTNAVDVVVADYRLGDPGSADGMDMLDAVSRWHPGISVRILATADPLGEILALQRGYLYFDKGPIINLVKMIRDNINR